MNKSKDWTEADNVLYEWAYNQAHSNLAGLSLKCLRRLESNAYVIAVSRDLNEPHSLGWFHGLVELISDVEWNGERDA